MSRTPLSSMAVLVLGAALSACGGGGVGEEAQSVLPGIYVDAATGNDTTGDGSSASPFKTIRRGIQGADVGEVVRVGPGTYDVANGERFPIIPGFGVTIQGTEARTMEGTVRMTRVVGGGYWSQDPEGRLHATFIPNDGNRLVGLIITDPEPAVSFGAKPSPVLLAFSGATVESCAFVDSSQGVRVLDGVSDCLLKDCAFARNGIGILVEGDGTGNRMEGCLVTDNGSGVMCFGAGMDFGGGAENGAGRNAFVANQTNDFIHFAGDNDLIFAEDCFWDHVAPTLAVGNPAPVANTDVWVVGTTGGVSTTGAALRQPSGTNGGAPPGGGTASP